MFYIQSYSMNSQKAPNIDSVLWVTVYAVAYIHPTDKAFEQSVLEPGKTVVFRDETLQP